MFEKTMFITGTTVACLLMGGGALWLAWLCFAHVPFWGAIFLYILVLLLAMLIFGEAIAAVSFVSGLVVAVVTGIIVFIYRKATASSRSGA